MKFIHSGNLFILLLVSSALESKGNFRHIFEQDGFPFAINYLQMKMQDQHKLNDMKGPEEQLKWDLYLFQKFTKLHLANPITSEKKGPDKESDYLTSRAMAMFMLRSSGKDFSTKQNTDALNKVTQIISPLRNIPNIDSISTVEAINTWIDNYRNQQPTLVKGPELRVKTSILLAWQEWGKRPEEKK